MLTRRNLLGATATAAVPVFGGTRDAAAIQPLPRARPGRPDGRPRRDGSN